MCMSLHGTTILCVRKDNRIVIAADGQVTMGSQIIKNTATKIHKFGADVVAGFAGNTADAITMSERLENLVCQNPGRLEKICIEFAKNLRNSGTKMDAFLIVANTQEIFMITGDGNVLRPEHDVASVGSGSSYALGAALALIDTALSADEIVDKAMTIAANSCAYTNDRFKKIAIEKKYESLVSR